MSNPVADDFLEIGQRGSVGRETHMAARVLSFHFVTDLTKQISNSFPAG